jgi:5-formyltetrahydrofolate cyclo-ligase
MGLNQEQAKQQLRRQLLLARSRLAAADVARRSAAIATEVLALPAFRAAAHVVLYAAIATEVDPASIATAATGLGKHVYYPVARRDRFEFASLGNGCASTGTETETLLPPDARAVCFLVPGLGFDERGVRLGRGSGWYDRALARPPTGVRVGLAYDFQLVPSLPEATWDVRMNAVVTEARVLYGDTQRIGQ